MALSKKDEGLHSPPFFAKKVKKVPIDCLSFEKKTHSFFLTFFEFDSRILILAENSYLFVNGCYVRGERSL